MLGGRERWRHATSGLACAIAAWSLVSTPAAATQSNLATSDADLARARMVRVIEMHDRETLREGGGGISRDVLYAMTKTPRHLFVPRALAPIAYLDRRIPLGHGQTEAEPFLTALMTDLADVARADSVLIAGAGGGYHAALLSGLAAEVRCVEMNPAIAAQARDRFARFYYDNVSIRTADPFYGWPESGRTFDAIIVRQAMPFAPGPLLRQLRIGGRLVMPLGGPGETQILTTIERLPTGELRQRGIMPVDVPALPGGPRI